MLLPSKCIFRTKLCATFLSTSVSYYCIHLLPLYFMTDGQVKQFLLFLGVPMDVLFITRNKKKIISLFHVFGTPLLKVKMLLI